MKYSLYINKIILFYPKSVQLVLTIMTINMMSLYQNEIAYCMENQDRETISTVCENLQQNTSNLEEARAILEEINTTRDPNRIEYLRGIINTISQETNVDLNSILYPHLQHTIRSTEGNSGAVYSEGNGSSIERFLLFTGIVIVGYLVIKNWESIKELLFDMGHRILVTLPTNTSPDQIMTVSRFLLTNEQTQRLMIRALISRGQA